jgi:DNA-binding response OmpR family regulator
MAKPMVLVVDDQPEYARLISLSLAREGFEVRTAGGGEDAIDRASTDHPDAVLLDVNMPGLDGFEVMAEMRARWPVPIIMVTGNGSLDQRRSGLDRGADDYVTKPFAPQELAARVRALLRRSGGPSTLKPGPLAPDASRAARQTAAGDAGPRTTGTRLGRRAARLLELFKGHPGKVLYHDELLAHALGPAFIGDTSLLREEIRRLRRALGVPAWTEGPIRTIHGVGYLYDPNGARAAARSRRPREPRRPAPGPARARGGR